MKKFIIDGHNLVPKIPGLSLSDPEDESKLIALLQEYGRLTRSQMDLFFDNAPPGKAGTKGSGSLRVHYVKQGISADEAIIAFMRNCTRDSTEIFLVTSDRRIHAEARSMRIRFIHSEVFSREMGKVFSSPQVVNREKEKTPSPQEVEEWLDLFSGKKSA